MKKSNLLMQLSIIIILFAFSANNMAQTSLYFESAATTSPKKYTFSSGDALYLYQGRNTSTSSVCPGYNDAVRTYRVQEHTFILELVSTTMDSISVYGVGSSDKERNFSKIEISSESKDGPFTDITNQVEIGPSMRYLSCGRNLTAWNLNAPLNSFVKFTVTLVSDGTTVAPTNISEFTLFPINGGPTTSVPEGVTAGKTIKERKYYSLTGLEVEKHAKGLMIEHIIYEDGSVKSVKVFKPE